MLISCMKALLSNCHRHVTVLNSNNNKVSNCHIINMTIMNTKKGLYFY